MAGFGSHGFCGVFRFSGVVLAFVCFMLLRTWLGLGDFLGILG